MLSNQQAKEILDDLLGGPISLALLTADPTRAGSWAAEVPTSGTGYNRYDVTGLFTAADLTLRMSILNALITFPTSLVAWGNISHVALADAPTPGTGNMKSFRRLSSDIYVPAGFAVSFAPGQLQFRAS